MDIQAATMTVPYHEARTAYRHYRTALTEKRATREDKALYLGLRAVLRGKKVLDINLAIGAGGLDVWGRPKLALSRADWPFVFLHGVSTNAGAGYHFGPSAWSSGRRTRGVVIVPETAFGQRATGVRGPRELHGISRAQVPTIPPQFRPTDDTLTDHHLLFEAVWQAAPTRDPLLLKHVDGPFFVVLAAWDLSPLEQAVLRARL